MTSKTLISLLLAAIIAIPFLSPQQERRGFKGVSAFAGMHKKFPVSRFMQQYPSDVTKPAIAVVWGTFGSDKRLTDSFVSRFSDRPHLIQVHLSNEPGRRAGKMYAGEFLKKLNEDQYNAALEKRGRGIRKALSRRILKIRAFFEPYMEDFGTTVVLTTGLESYFSDKANQTIVRAIRKYWPDVIVGRNSLYPSSYGGADVY